MFDKGDLADDETTAALFVSARHDAHGRRLPQAIAHRGFKAQHPENTMGAFIGAVKAGAHAIETDMHLSKDGVAVLSHVSRDCLNMFDAKGSARLMLLTGRNAQEMLRKRGEDHRL